MNEWLNFSVSFFIGKKIEKKIEEHTSRNLFSFKFCGRHSSSEWVFHFESLEQSRKRKIMQIFSKRPPKSNKNEGKILKYTNRKPVQEQNKVEKRKKNDRYAAITSENRFLMILEKKKMRFLHFLTLHFCSFLFSFFANPSISFLSVFSSFFDTFFRPFFVLGGIFPALEKNPRYCPSAFPLIRQKNSTNEMCFRQFDLQKWIFCCFDEISNFSVVKKEFLEVKFDCLIRFQNDRKNRLGKFEQKRLCCLKHFRKARLLKLVLHIWG